jgi:hypothetical protein
MRQPSAASAWQYAPGISANNTKLRMPAMQSEPPRAGRRRRDALVANIDRSQGVNCTGSFNLSFSAAITASVRLATLSALRMAVT